MSLTYKVVETTEVTDVILTTILNEWTAQGWTFESFNFAMRESSRRPQMAFVLFSRPVRDENENENEDENEDGEGTHR